MEQAWPGLVGIEVLVVGLYSLGVYNYFAVKALRSSRLAGENSAVTSDKQPVFPLKSKQRNLGAKPDFPRVAAGQAETALLRERIGEIA